MVGLVIMAWTLINKVNGFASVHHGSPLARRNNNNNHNIIRKTRHDNDNHNNHLQLEMVVAPINIAGGGHRPKPVVLKHLFRHYDDISMDCFLRCAEPASFLKSCGYTQPEIDQMAEEWPALLAKDVHDHLAPHIRFLVKTLGGGTGDLFWATDDDGDDETTKEEDEECDISTKDDDGEDDSERHKLRVSDLAKKVVPVRFFNVRVEKSLAPWHAYLCWQKDGLPCGKQLLENDSGDKFREFLTVCETSKRNNFVDLCNAWERRAGKTHTKEDIINFEVAFHEGLVPAVRNHLHTKTECDPGEMVELLLLHGANHLEDDHHGASLLHWAAGTGNKRAVEALLQARQDDGVPPEEIIATDHDAKDGATPLHWAASGVTAQGVFGTGGHVEICRLLLELAPGKDLASETTYTHNSPLEWAAWAGSLDVAKLLIEDYCADPHFCSENGNVAHWACAGGSLPMCQYLANNCGVDFTVTSEVKGWTPLHFAVSEGHTDVAEWLLQWLHSDVLSSQDKEGLDLLMHEVWDAVKKDSPQQTRQDV